MPSSLFKWFLGLALVAGAIQGLGALDARTAEVLPEGHYEEYRVLDVSAFAGVDIKALADGWDAEMGIGALGGVFFTPRKILKVTDLAASTYLMFRPMEAIQLRALREPFAIVTQAYFEQATGLSFGVMSGYTTLGYTRMETVGLHQETVIATYSFVPILAAVEHRFWCSNRYRHLYSEVRNQSESPTGYSYVTKDFYTGYRLSGGPAFLMDTEVGTGDTPAWNFRVEFLLGIVQGHGSLANCSIYYDMMYFDPSWTVDNHFTGALGLNWAFSLNTRHRPSIQEERGK